MEMREDLLYISSAFDLSRDRLIPLADSSTLENHCTLSIRDGKITMYFRDKTTPIDFKQSVSDTMQWINERGLIAIKTDDTIGNWHKFNPNPLKKNTTDCTIRAYSAAFNISWDTAYDLATNIAKGNGYILDSGPAVSKILTEGFHCELDQEYKK